VLAVAPHEWQTFHSPLFGASGMRGVPDVAETANTLRWVSAHRDEAREMGRAASDWVLRHRNIWHKGPAVLDAMERHAPRERPLRRARTVWVPTWRTTCGVAEYTAHLVESVPGVRVVSRPPAMGGLQLLHIQHEDSIFDEAEFVRCLLAARQERVPTAVTLHTVRTQMRSWEAEADALVALTSRGCDMLRARWPTKPVEMIPPGCPTWFPRRKSTTGKVIGAFGFLGSHKGFWQLLDVLKQMPEAELLMFSYSRLPELEARWEQDARGLKVRRVREFLPTDEIARRLAAEADILAFWYDDFREASASYAVRIGLATGVPVLASPTGWFSDLRDVTYQPKNLYEGVRRLLDDAPLRESLRHAAREYCHANSWPRIAERHLALWRRLERR